MTRTDNKEQRAERGALNSYTFDNDGKPELRQFHTEGGGEVLAPKKRRLGNGAKAAIAVGNGALLGGFIGGTFGVAAGVAVASVAMVLGWVWINGSEELVAEPNGSRS
jgi:hypothetical protein